MIGTLGKTLTTEQAEIIKAALYFDIFKYPLTADELFENSAISVAYQEFRKELDVLLKNKLLRQEGEFILCPERTKSDISRRLNGNAGAKGIMATAYKYSRIISSFPFVEGVCLSGSLSKNYYDKNGDIDFFIITKPGRLWICRTLLIFRYKLLPKQRKKFWCVNYFIASDNLTIPDINVFTGTELAYLIPTVNYPIYKKILEQNKWYKNKFPNKKEAAPQDCMNTPRPLLKSILEKILDGNLGTWLDNKLLEMTLKRWRKKYVHMGNEDFDLQFRSRKDACKRHVHGFQNKILVQWENRSREFERQFDVSLNIQAA